MRFLPPFAVLAAMAAFGQVGESPGPAPLSRGGALAPNSRVAIRPYINISGLYTSGLLTGPVRPDGTAAPLNAFGAEAAVGLYGCRSWRHTVLGINYRGDYRRYDKLSPYNGNNQFLTLGLTHNFTRHLVVTLREGLGSFTQNLNYLGTFGFYDPVFANVPTDELLENRTIYLTTMADVTYQKSARLSFNWGASGFTVHRQGGALYSVVGATGRADVAYRLSRRTTVGVDYLFTHFGYSNAFGAGDFHSAAVDYSVQLTRWWTVRLRVGMTGIESLYLNVVNVDPLVAAITGQRQGLRVAYSRMAQPNYSANLTRLLRHASASLYYNHGATPGNGVYLTSRQNTGIAYFSYSGIRLWSLTSSFSVSDMQSLGQQIKGYRSISGGFGASRAISHRNIYLTARSDIRHIVAGRSFTRKYYSVALGIAFSPGDLPLRLW